MTNTTSNYEHNACKKVSKQLNKNKRPSSNAIGLRDLGGYDHQMGTPIKSSKYFDHITGQS
jgi:hypothetical protein